MLKLRSIAVFCGSNSGHSLLYKEAALQLGQILASKKIKIVYGGGKVGLMGVLADAALAVNGEVVGVITDFLLEKEVGHPSLSELIVVNSMHQRKAMMEQLADGFIIMPGGFGTLDEFAEIFTWSQLGLHAKPIGILNINNYFNLFIEFVNHMVAEGFLKAENKKLLVSDEYPDNLLKLMEVYTPQYSPKWMDSSDI